MLRGLTQNAFDLSDSRYDRCFRFVKRLVSTGRSAEQFFGVGKYFELPPNLLGFAWLGIGLLDLVALKYQ